MFKTKTKKKLEEMEKEIKELGKRVQKAEANATYMWGTKNTYDAWIGRWDAPQYVGVEKVLTKIMDHFGLEFKEQPEDIKLIKKPKAKKAT
jgi:hypothetical protein